MYNTFTDMEHMEDAVGCIEDDVKHANEDVNDQEIREDYDNDNDCATSLDHEDGHTIGNDGDVDADVGTIS